MVKEQVLGYARVSTKKQKDDGSIDIQIEAIKRYCEAYNYDLQLPIYKDDGISAFKERPKHKVMMKRALDEEQIKGVIVNDLTRFGRSTVDLLIQIQKLDEAGKKFISIRDNIDISTSSGRLLLKMLSAIAEYEKEIITGRMEAGKEKAKLEGTRSGKPMHRPEKEIDWELVKDRRIHHYSWSKIAKEIGVSLPTILKRKNKEGIL